MTADQEASRAAFFEKLRKNKPTRETLDAIERIESLGDDERVQLKYTENDGDHAILVRVLVVSETTSLFKIESSGAIELLNDLHDSQRVKKALSWLGYQFGSKEPSLDNKKPRFKRGDWEADVAKIVRVVQGFARQEEDVVAYADPLRARARGLAAFTTGPAKPAFPMTSPRSGVADAKIPPGPAETPVDWRDEKVRVAFTRWLRSRQSEFRNALLRAYGSRCCISGDGPVEVLEAAHIKGHAESGDNSLQNGLLMRADLHALFDAGLLRIEPETRRVVIDERASSYGRYDGARLREPESRAARPETELLRARWEVARGLVEETN